MLKKVVFTCVIGCLSTVAANAADIEAAPDAYDWSGFYLGAQVGYGWGDFDSHITVSGERIDTPSPSGDFDGIIGGGHIGYNIQVDRFVLGIEGDLEASGMDGSDIWRAEKENIDIGVAGSLRARAGVAFDRLLVFGTAGLAGADMEYTTTIQGFGPGFTPKGYSSSNDVTYWGYTIGGGLEYAFNDAFSARVEYRYTDLGSESFNPKTLICIPTDCKIESDVAFQAVRAGITWHLRGL